MQCIIPHTQKMSFSSQNVSHLIFSFGLMRLVWSRKMFLRHQSNLWFWLEIPVQML